MNYFAALLAGVLIVIPSAAWSQDSAEPTLVESLALDQWVGASTDEIVLYTNAGEVAARRLAHRIGRFLDTLRVVTRADKKDGRPPVRIFAFASKTQYAAFRIPGAAGYMAADFNTNLLAISIDERQHAVPVLYHELTHDLLNATGDAAYPTWYDEGFAELLSTLTIREDLATIGITPSTRIPELEAHESVDLEALLGSRSMATMEDPDRFYAEAWLLVHDLQLRTKRVGHGLARYLDFTERGSPEVEAFSRAFGMERMELLEALRAHRDQITDGTSLSIRVEVPLRETEITVEHVAEERIGTLLGELALTVGQLDSATSVLDHALEIAPHAPRAIAARAQVDLASGERSAARARVAAALERSADVVLHEAMGFVFLDVAMRSEALTEYELDDVRGAMDDALPHFDACIAADPDRASCHVGAALANMGTIGSATSGLRHSERALTLRPFDARVHFVVAQSLLSSGDLDGGLARLRKASFLAHDRKFARQINRVIAAIKRSRNSE